MALRIQVENAVKEVENLKTRLGKYEKLDMKTNNIARPLSKYEKVEMKTNIIGGPVGNYKDVDTKSHGLTEPGICM